MTEPSAPVTFCVSVVICYRFLCGLSTFRRESVRRGGTYSTSWKFFKRNFLLLVCASRKTTLFDEYSLFQLGMQFRVGLFCRITIVHFLNMVPNGARDATLEGARLLHAWHRLWLLERGVYGCETSRITSKREPGAGHLAPYYPASSS